MRSKRRPAFREWLEFIPAWTILKLMGLLPRRVALFFGSAICTVVYLVHGRLRRTAFRNLQMAMPALPEEDRKFIVRGAFQNLGRLLAEFSQFPKISKDNIHKIVAYDGLENYLRASEKGQGVLFLTGHLGAWELCAYAQGAYGFPLSFLVRPIDNPLANQIVKAYREGSGNKTIDKNESVKQVLTDLKRGLAVGFLIDVNTLEGEGVFCDFFGIPACSSTGLATFALRTGAPVVPGFIHWDRELRKHKLVFEPEAPLTRTGDLKEDVRANTALFTSIIERQIRQHPDQWLWVHKRWRTRPEGENDLYDVSRNIEEDRRAIKGPLKA
ncbi:MAG: lipid A biosynthesis acyltransferase [Blastocatellia bacterium AA13]|nr:MAG: lipid A biosynthesis acyltransferase [Blastocatellia bacterium AA13]